MKFTTTFKIVCVLFLALLATTPNSQAQCTNNNALTGSTLTVGTGTVQTNFNAGQYQNALLFQGSTYEVTTCGLAGFDTQITVYRDDNGNFVAYNDDACGLQSRVVFTAPSSGSFRLLIDQFNCVNSGANSFLKVDHLIGPVNENCGAAINLGIGGSVSGDTRGAITQSFPTCGTSNGTGGGLWYRIVGNGSQLRLSTCGAATYDTKIRVYTGDCASLSCVTGNDDACSLQSQVDFCTNPGQEYYAYVHGFGSSEGTFTLSLSDQGNNPPSISCPANVTTNVIPSWCSASFTPTQPTASDDCSTPIITQTAGPTGPIFPVGTSTLTFQATDGSGQTASCSYTVTVNDNEAPQFTCPSNITTNIDGGLCTSLVTYSLPTGSDNCDGGFTASVTSGLGSGAQYPIGITTNELSATDVAGNTGQCTFTVTVVDNIAPVAVCQNVTAQLNVSGTATVNANDVDNGSSDNCGIQNITLFPSSFDCNDIGILPATLTVQDQSGNTNACSAIITVEDNINPTAVCQDITLQLGGGGFVPLFAADLNGGSNDNCAVGSLTSSVSSFNCSDAGSNLVTLTVEDVAGNSATCNSFVTVEDNVNPTAVCQDITVQLDNSGNATITGADLDDGSTDNCGIALLNAFTSSFNCSNVGPNLVNLNVVDNFGNFDNCSATVTVEDNVAPTAVCQDVTVQLDVSGNGATTATAVNDGSSDACGIASLSISPSIFNCSNVGTNTVTLTVTDNNSNTATCTSTVTVEDNIAPFAFCQNVTVQLNGSGNASITTGDIDNVSSDACGIGGLSVSPSAFTCSEIGGNTVTLTVTDNNGNASTCTATVTVEDNVAPTATCQDITVQLDDGGNALPSGDGSVSIIGADIDGGSTDACGGVTLSASPTSFTCSDIGTNNVTLTVTDGSLNSSTCTAVVTVEDNVAPVVLCQDITVYVDAAGNGEQNAFINGALVERSDNCQLVGSITITGPNNYGCGLLPGLSNIRLRQFDTEGNFGDCFFDVTIQDTLTPTAICQDVTVQLDATGSVSIDSSDIDGGSTDNCTVSSITVSPSAFTCSEIGANTVTLTAIDQSGNSATCIATVTVEDNVAPIATCQDITIQLDGSGNASITAGDIDGGSSDACGVASLSATPTAFTCSEVGTNNVTLTVTDNNSNSATCTAIVTVEDNGAPTATCQDITVQLDASGNASITAGDIDGGSTDACGTASISASPTAFTCANVGANTVTLTVTDNNSNSSTCTATVTVEDNVAPTASCQDITVQLNAGGSGSIAATDVDGGSSDACGIASLSVTPSSFSCGTTGANTVTLTVTDNNGNSATCSAIVTVEDNVGPNAVCADGSVFLDGSGNATVTASSVGGSSSDACGLASLSVTPSAFNCSNIGANTVTLTATDGSGNSSTCTATITVFDDTNPTATCQDITIQLDGSGSASITAGDVDDGSSDACGIAGLSVSPAVFSCADVGGNSVTLTVTDNNSNSATCTALVTVEDTTPPTALCQDVTVQLDAAGTASLDASTVDNGSTDNCGVASFTIDGSVSMSFTCTDLGTVSSIVFEAIDDNGLTNTCLFDITVEDLVPPTAICQDVTVQLDASGNGTLTATEVDNGSTDNCAIDLITINGSSSLSFTCSDVGVINGNSFVAVSGPAVSTSCVFAITVEDNISPVATCQDLTVQLDGAGNASIVAGDIDNGSSDVCGLAGLSVSPSTFTCTDLGANTVVLTATDINANEGSCTATVTVEDNIAPLAVCQDITVTLDGSGSYPLTGLELDGGSTDNCPGLVLTPEKTPLTCADAGTVNIDLLVTDAFGNTGSCTASVTVFDLNPPTAVCQDITVQLDSAGSVSILPADVDGGSSDACDVALSVSPAVFDCDDVGPNTVTLGATDAFTLTSCTATVTVEDNIAPTLTCAPTDSVDTDPGQCTATVNVTPPAVWDNCTISNGITTLVGLSTPGDSITDENLLGAFDQISVNLPTGSTVLDVNIDVDISHTWVSDIDVGLLSPSFSGILLLSRPVNCSDDNLLITFDDEASTTASTLDNWCMGTNPWYSGSAQPLNPLSTFDGEIASGLWTFYVQDFASFDNGTINSWSITIEFNDPNGRTLAQTFTSDLRAERTSTVDLSAYAARTAEQKVEVNHQSFARAAGDTLYTLTNDFNGTADASGTYPVGTTPVVWTITDAGGNTATCIQNVVVTDNEAPNAVCQDITVQLDASGNASITAADVDGGSTDNCGIASLSATPTSFTCSEVGANTITLTVTDVNTNSATCIATVTVEDNVAPTAICQDVTVQLDGSGNATVTSGDIDNGSSDACGIASLSVSPGTFTCTGIGGNTTTLTVTDNNGNTGSCTATVTIEDTVAPTAICQDVTVQLDASGNATITAADVDGGSTDNCSSVTLSASPTAFTCAEAGANTVTLTVTDGSGNAATCAANVTVEDNVPPTAVCQDITVQLDAGGSATITANEVDDGSSDACGIASLSIDDSSFDCTDIGAPSVTPSVWINELHYDNASGDVGEFFEIAGTAGFDLSGFTVVLYNGSNGTTYNTISLSGIIPNEGSGFGAISFSLPTNGLQNGAPDGLALIDGSAAVLEFLSYEGSFSATDGPANGTSSVDIGVSETSSTPIGESLQRTGTGVSGGDFTFSGPAVESPGSINAGQTATAPSGGGVTVTLTATDVNGNSATCTSTVTVEDNVVPIAICQDITVQLDGTGNASITAGDVDNGSSDACGIDFLSVTPSAFTCAEVGANTVTLTANDVNGNSSTCSATVSIEDNVPPTATCQDITVQLDGTGNVAITASDIDNGSSDNCGAPSLSVTPSAFNCSNVGANAVTLTATDANTNSSTCTATVTVEDNVAPTAVCQDITVQLDASGNAGIIAADVDGGSSDACGLASTTIDISSFDCSNVGDQALPVLWINEFHYDNTGGDVGEFVEVAGTAGYDLSTVSIVLYNGSNGEVYDTENLTGTIDNEGSGFGAVSFPISGIQNGSPDAIALVDNGTVIEFISYEGVLTAANGPAIGMLSVDVGVSEPSTTAIGESLQRTGSGGSGNDFTWAGPTPESPGSLNTGQTIVASPDGTAVVLTSTDANGNSSSCIAYVTVEDNVPPTAACQDITIQLDASGNASISAADVDGGSTDNCGVPSLSVSPSSFTCAEVGSNTVTLTVTDVNTNTSTCTANVFVEDYVVPIALCQDITVQLDAGGSGSTTANDVDGGSSDACGVASLSVTPTSFTCSDVGANTVTLTVTDNNSNVSTCTATVTVEDNIAPVAICQDITVQLDGSGNATITTGDINNGSSDACGVSSLSLDQTIFNCATIGSGTVTLTVTDANGNSSTCTATVTIEDNIPPVAVCQDLTLQLDASGNAAITANDVDGGSTDNCAIASLTISNSIFDCGDVGAGGGTPGAPQTYNINTPANPSVGGVCPGNLGIDNTYNCAFDGQPAAPIGSYTDGNAPTDVLSSMDVVLFNACNGNFDLFLNGVFLASGTQTGETCSCQSIAVNPGVAVNIPVTVTPAIQAAYVPGGTNSLSLAASASAAGAQCFYGADVTVTMSSGGTGANSTVLTVTDVNGNASTCTANITVEDNVPPVAICQDITVQLDASGNGSHAAADIDGGSSDACGITSLSASPTTYTCSEVGTQTSVLTVTDNNGNVGSCTANVTVEDNVAPTAVCQDITVQLGGSGSASITATDVDGGSSDACGIAGLSVTPASFTCSEVGPNTVTLTVTDVNGNSSTCTANVTVEDNEAPIAVCQDVTVEAMGNQPGGNPLNASDFDGGSTDNCGIAGFAVSPASYDCSDINLTQTATLTVTDVNGNTATCTANYIVIDAIPPTPVCQDVTVQLDASGTAPIVAADLQPFPIFDVPCSNGQPLVPSTDITNVSCANVGTPVIVTLSVTDAGGNVGSCTSTVTVEDNVAPTAVCQDITVQLDASGNASITATDVDGGSTDACGVASLSATPTSFTCTEVGGNTETLTVTDVNANSSTCTANVTVEDNVAPIAVCQDATVQLDAAGNGSLAAGDVDGGSSDNCGIASLSVTPAVFSCTEVGANTVSLTVTDVNGNAGSCTATVTVEDNVAPTAVCQDITVQLDGSGNATITAGDVDGGSTDACGIASLSVDQATFNCATVGSGSVTLTVTDVNGNSSTCTATVSIEDAVPPTAVCTDITVQLDASGNASITAADVDGGSTDNCAIASLAVTPSSFTCSEVGSNTVTLTVTDVNGNSSTCTANVLVEDNIAPTALCQDITVQLDGAGNASISASDIDGGSSDVCGIAGLAASTTSFACADVGSNTVTLTVTDVNGNSSSCAATVTVEDNVPPIAICNDITVQLDAGGSYTIPDVSVFDGGGTDACGIASASATPTTFTCADVGSNTVTVTITDVNGNSSSCTPTVTVEDDVAPTATCQDVTVQLDASGNGAITTADVDGGSTDNCGIAALSVSPAAFTCAEIGVNGVTLTVTDANGNATSCSANVSVEDNVAPSAICQDITIQLDATGVASITAADVDGGSSDACGIASLSAAPTAFTCAEVGANTVTLTVTDNNGNTKTCTSTVTVEDNVAPVAVCQDVTIQLDNSGTAIVLAGDIDNGSSDACGISSVSLDVTTFGCADGGPNTVTLTVTDVNGNSSTCTATVTVDGQGVEATIVPDFIDKLCQGESVLLTVSATGTIQDYLWSTGETTPTILASDTGTYSVIVTSTTSCTDTAYYDLTIDPEDLTSSYTIIAERNVVLKKRNVVATGGVGVTSALGTAKVRNNSTVTTFVKASAIDISANSSVADVIVDPANVSLPGFQNNTTTGHPVEFIAPNQNIVLNGCAYDLIEIKSGATVTFTCDNVFIGELVVANDVTIQFAGPANLYIRENLVFGPRVDFNPTAEFVYVYLMRNFLVNPGSSVVAHMYAVRNIQVKGSSSEPVSMVGQFIGRRVRGVDHVTWGWDVKCDPVPVVLPPPSIVRALAEEADAPDEVRVELGDMALEAYPNPFMKTAMINFRIPESARTTIEIVDINGSVLEVADMGMLEAGLTHEYEYLPGETLSAGTYIVRVVSGSHISTTKLVYIR